MCNRRLVNEPKYRYVRLSTFGRTLGPFRLCLAWAHVQTSLQTSTNTGSGPPSCAPLRPRASKTAKEHPMITGTVKFYNDQKGLGFIQPEDGSRDVFVHATALERAGMRGLVEGQKVSFDTAENRRSGKMAVNSIETA